MHMTPRDAMRRLIPLLLLPAQAFAEPAQEWRCTTDDLDPSAAIARVEWARQCGLLNNLSPSGPNAFVSSTKAFDQNFQWAKEYKEANTGRAFSGNLNQYNVNYYNAYALFDATPQYSTFKEPTGRPTAGYWKWSHYSPRVQSLYPSFENTPIAGGDTQLFPHPSLANCNLYKDKTGTSQWMGDFFVIAYCESGCYTPEQKLRFGDGEVGIADAMAKGLEDVVTLGPEATLDNPQFRQDRVYSYTTEIHDSEHITHTFVTRSGGMLRVTSEHPVLTSDGRLVEAQSLSIGQELLRQDGTPDPIVSVVKSTYFGKVYNLKPESRELVSNILVAQGFLVGSARFQNEKVEYMNRVLLFRGIPDEVMPQ
ncbi:cell surface protein [Archangium gephyra]|nr:cell surface protein [Archangium gephyra]